MDRLNTVAEQALDVLQELEERRETAIRRSRDIIRETKRIIHSIHTGNDDRSVGSLSKMVSELNDILANDPNMYSVGPVDDALMEYAETMILLSVVDDGPVPSFSELDIPPRSWVLGLADSIGELRRILLDSIMVEDITKAEMTFSKMENIYQTIMMFDIPDALLPIRRKQDVARGIMERTRTDLTNAILMLKIRN